MSGLSQTLTVTIAAMSIMATLAAICLWVGADRITSLFSQLKPLQQVSLSKAFQIGSLVVWARLIQQVLVGIEQAYQNYKLINLVTTIQSLLTSVGMLSIVWIGGQTYELMQWQAFVNILILFSHILITRFLLKDTSIHLRWNGTKALEVVKYSIVVWLSSLGSVLFSRIDRLIVGNILGTHVLGIYAAITDITSQINGISALPVQPLVPFLSRLSSSNIEMLKLRDHIKKAVEVNTFIALGLGGSMIALAPFLLKVILPHEFDTSYTTIFQIATTIYSLYSLNAVGYYVLFGVKAANVCAIIQLIVGLMSLLSITIGAYHFGLIGAIMGNSLYLCIYGLTFISMKYLNIPNILWIKWIWIPTVLFLLFTVISLLVPFNPIISIAIFSVQTSIIIGWFVANYKPKILHV